MDLVSQIVGSLPYSHTHEKSLEEEWVGLVRMNVQHIRPVTKEILKKSLCSGLRKPIQLIVDNTDPILLAKLITDDDNGQSLPIIWRASKCNRNNDLQILLNKIKTDSLAIQVIDLWLAFLDPKFLPVASSMIANLAHLPLKLSCKTQTDWLKQRLKCPASFGG